MLHDRKGVANYSETLTHVNLDLEDCAKHVVQHI
jgi:hypothetical protein